MGDNIRLSFSYPENIKEKLVELAKKENRKLASYIKKILNQHIKELVKDKRS